MFKLPFPVYILPHSPEKRLRLPLKHIHANFRLDFISAIWALLLEAFEGLYLLENTSFEQKSAFLSAMANEQRLRVLDILTKGEMPVGELADMIGLSQSALSQHLAKLRAAHMVRTRRDAQTVYYTVNSENVRRMLSLLEDIFAAPEIARAPLSRTA